MGHPVVVLHADGGDHLVRLLAFQHLFQMVIAAQTPQTSHLFCCMVRYVPDRVVAQLPIPLDFLQVLQRGLPAAYNEDVLLVISLLTEVPEELPQDDPLSAQGSYADEEE